MVEIVVIAEGQPWYGFTNLSVSDSMDAAFNTLTMSTTDRRQEGIEVWNIRDGSEIEVFVDGVRVFKGDVNKYKVDLNTTHSISLKAATRARDLVQSSHIGRLNFKTEPPEAIIREICEPYGVDVDILVEMSGLELNEKTLSYNMRAGVKSFDAIRRLAEKDGLTVFTDSDGRIIVGDGRGFGRNAGLTTGDYVSLSTEHDIGKAFSEIIIKSQWKNKIDKVEKQPTENNYVHDYSQTTTIEAVLASGPDPISDRPKKGKKKTFVETQQTQVGFKNSAQTRHRPLLFLNNEKPAADETYAKYTNRRFAGQSVSAFVEVKSIYDKVGAPYKIGNSIHVYEPLADLNDTLIISGRSINISPQGGLLVGLALSTPETYRTGLTATSSRRRSIRRSGGAFTDLVRALVADL